MPTIKKIAVGNRYRYRVVADVGTNPITGKRVQKTITRDTRREVAA